MAVNFGDNFNIGAFKPIDLRLVVDSPTDLTLIQYPYKGMLVSVKNDSGFVRTYRLKTDNSAPLTNWEVIGQSSSLAALPDVYIVSAEKGDVLVYGTNASGNPSWTNRGPFVESVVAGTNGSLAFTFSDGTFTSIQIAGGSLENNNYTSNNFIVDGENYTQSLSTIDEILGAIAPTRAANLTSTGLVLSATTLYSAKIPSGLSGAWVDVAGSTITNYIVDGTYVLTSPNAATAFNAGQYSNPASYGTLYHLRNGVPFVTRNLSLGAGTTNASDADGDSALNVTSVALYNSIWAKANANISYTQNAADEGTITHALQSTVAGTSNVTTLNYDPINTAPTFASLPYIDQGTLNLKYLSGIAHYGLNSEVTVDFIADAGIFDRCYHPTAVAVVSGTAFPSFNLNPLVTPSYTDQFAPGTQTITLSTANVSTGAANGTLTTLLQKPSGLNLSNNQPYVNVDAISARVNTYGTVSTTKVELFLDEAQRLQIGTNTPFVSNAVLANGDAQVRNGSLTYGNIDYPTKSGDQIYERIFTVSPQQNGGSMTFVGFTASNIAPYNTGNINMFLRLTTNGLFYDLGRPFGSNNGSGDGSSPANSIGAQVSTSAGTLNYTFGVVSTFPSNQYRMIIVFRNSTYSITSITIA